MQRWQRIAVMAGVVATLLLVGWHMANRAPALDQTWIDRPVGSAMPPLHMDSIELRRTPCFGACPVYTVKVERNGTATYRAQRYVYSPDGMRRGDLVMRQQVPDRSLRALIAAVESPDYAWLRPEYVYGVTDLPGTYLSVRSRGVEHTTYVYAVPCRGDTKAWIYDRITPGELVPNIFCSVVKLVDLASCAQYWGRYGPGPQDLQSTEPPLPIPPRCTPTP